MRPHLTVRGRLDPASDEKGLPPPAALKIFPILPPPIPSNAFEGEVGAETEPPTPAPAAAAGTSARRRLSCTNRWSWNPRYPALPNDPRCVSLCSGGGGGGAGDDDDDGAEGEEDEDAEGECCRRRRTSSGLRPDSVDLLVVFFGFAAGALVGVVGCVVVGFVVVFVLLPLVEVERSAERSGLSEGRGVGVSLEGDLLSAGLSVGEKTDGDEKSKSSLDWLKSFVSSDRSAAS